MEKPESEGIGLCWEATRATDFAAGVVAGTVNRPFRFHRSTLAQKRGKSRGCGGSAPEEEKVAKRTMFLARLLSAPRVAWRSPAGRTVGHEDVRMTVEPTQQDRTVIHLKEILFHGE